MKSKFCPPSILFLVLIPVSLLASNNSIKYPPLQVGAGYNYVADTGDLSEYLNSDNGIAFFVNTPVIVGSFEFAYTNEGYKKNTNQGADYSAWSWAFGWNYPLELYKGILISPGFHVGSYKMYFDIPSDNEFEKDETENYIELLSRVSIPLTGNFSIYCEINKKRIYTYHPIDITNIHAGLVLTIGKQGNK